jgi:hypothetical protein
VSNDCCKRVFVRWFKIDGGGSGMLIYLQTILWIFGMGACLNLDNFLEDGT